MGHECLRVRIIPGDRKRAPVSGTRRAPAIYKLGHHNSVERLDHTRLRQMCRQQFARRRFLPVQLFNHAIPFPIIVVCIDHDLACERQNRD